MKMVTRSGIKYMIGQVGIGVRGSNRLQMEDT